MAGVRCFIGLPLPQAWCEALDRAAGRLAQRLTSRIAWTRTGNWHVTLKFLGDVDEERLPELRQALRGLAWESFALRLGPAGEFAAGRGAPRTLWAGLAEGGEGCAHLAAEVETALAGLGYAREARAFRPHVTLGRVKDAAAGDDWGRVADELRREAFAAARAGEMVLWRSILGPQGPKYVALEVFSARDHAARPEKAPA